jgi:tetratricopeptide (TPR) repeat protein
VNPRSPANLAIVAIAIAVASAQAVFAGEADAAATRHSQCNQVWNDLSRQFQGQPKALGEKWQAMRPQCAGTGVYEFHWANVLEPSGRRPEAIEYLSKVLATDIPDRASLEVELNSMQFSQAALEHGRDPQTLTPIHHGIEAVLRDHPDNPFALTENARQLYLLSKYAEAYTSADKALQFDKNSWGAATWLIEAGSQSGHCKDVIGLIVPAIKSSENFLLGNAGYMYAAVQCYLIFPVSSFRRRSAMQRAWRPLPFGKG